VKLKLFREAKKEKQKMLCVVGKEGETANEALMPSA
jgi:hypothetical protein